MKYIKQKQNYVTHPTVKVKGTTEKDVLVGYPKIVEQLVKDNGRIVVVDTYPAVRDSEVLPPLVEGLKPEIVIETIDLFYDEAEITKRMESHLTEDRVFGIIYYGNVIDFIDNDKLEVARKKVKEAKGKVLVYGFGAGLVTDKADIFIYAELARWEIQQRYRSKEIGNYKCSNLEEDVLRKYKRAYFIEWRIADKHKRDMYDRFDYVLDTNKKDNPKMITNKVFCMGINQTVNGPFRVTPYFDPGVWGGQWMKEVFNLEEKPNYAWSFDGVPEENSLLLEIGNEVIELPSYDVVYLQSIKLLGEKVFARFGAEFPIRFDFLDTIEGQNLSLQVHPSREYVKKLCGMQYTQDESYYILEAVEGATVYLGTKTGVNPDEMIQALADGQKGVSFDAEKYINIYPAKKHDHFLIPAGTVHCSASGCMVLEISATPYIFTFKLWDWDRLGMDGLPRPIHLEHGKHNIRFDRDTEWTTKNLVNNLETIHDGEYHEEKTGLHELEFIETRRFTTDKKVAIKTKESVNVLNLVEGTSAIVESPTNSFDPYTVHYAETFIIPEHVKEYTIRPENDETIKVLQAYVRV